MRGIILGEMGGRGRAFIQTYKHKDLCSDIQIPAPLVFYVPSGGRCPKRKNRVLGEARKRSCDAAYITILGLDFRAFGRLSLLYRWKPVRAARWLGANQLFRVQNLCACP